MNILFLYNSYINPIKGGVQRVTYILSNYFEKKGHNVFFVSLNKEVEQSATDKRQFFLPENNKCDTEKNRVFLSSFIHKNKIDVIINQGALGKDCSNLSFAINELNIPLISVLHSSLLDKIKNFSVVKKGSFEKRGLSFILPLMSSKIGVYLLLLLYKLKYKSHIASLCENSTKLVLLSDNFKDEIRFFVGENNRYNEKIVSLPNPCSFDDSYNFNLDNKEKTLLFVGRIDFSVKRVDVLLNIWSELSKKHADWTLVIVGDGPELEKAKEIVINKKIVRVSFEGFQKPEKYYKEASIFCMTSSYEGFGLVLIEAMHYGVVPFAFNSYKSVTDIIDDNINGKLIEPFNEKKYVSSLSELMVNEERRVEMANNAIIKSSNFSIDYIGEQWVELFNAVID